VTVQSPLTGVTVVDFTQVMLGPCATQMLGDFGADVIKVERKGAGDLSRHALPDPDGPDNPVFRSLNRNKRSLEVDLRQPDDLGLVLRLLSTADVVVNNFRAGVMDRMGLGYERLRESNPGIIYAEGTGFGPTGPLSGKGGQDVLAQAYTGLMDRRSDPDLPLSVYPTTFADFSAGMHLVQGILLALLAREKTGRGQRVEVSLYDSVLAAQMQEAAMLRTRGTELNWGAQPLCGVFDTSDGAVVMVGAFKPNPLAAICAALGLPDLSAQDEFATPERQASNRQRLQDLFRDRFVTGSTAHWLARLDEQDVLCGPVRSLAEALAEPQTAINGMRLEYLHPDTGEFRGVGSPVHLSETPATVRLPAPALGQHTAEIRAAAAAGDGSSSRPVDLVE
jgi:formyl-CoA transferase